MMQVFLVQTNLAYDFLSPNAWFDPGGKIIEIDIIFISCGSFEFLGEKKQNVVISSYLNEWFTVRTNSVHSQKLKFNYLLNCLQ